MFMMIRGKFIYITSEGKLSWSEISLTDILNIFPVAGFISLRGTFKYLPLNIKKVVCLYKTDFILCFNS